MCLKVVSFKLIDYKPLYLKVVFLDFLKFGLILLLPIATLDFNCHTTDVLDLSLIIILSSYNYWNCTNSIKYA